MIDKATASVPVSPATSELSLPDMPQGGGAVGIVISIVGGILWLRRKFSKDNVETAKDKTEKDLLTTVMAERDRFAKAAEEAWKVRAEDAKLIGQLTAEVKHLTIANETLVASVTSLKDQVHALRNDLQKQTIELHRSNQAKKATP